jgi:hypothetical protein
MTIADCQGSVVPGHAAVGNALSIVVIQDGNRDSHCQKVCIR